MSEVQRGSRDCSFPAASLWCYVRSLKLRENRFHYWQVHRQQILLLWTSIIEIATVIHDRFTKQILLLWGFNVDIFNVTNIITSLHVAWHIMLIGYYILRINSVTTNSRLGIHSSSWHHNHRFSDKLKASTRLKP